MTNLLDLVRMAKSVFISPSELIDALESLAFSGRDLGFVEATDVITLFDRCSPGMSKADYFRVRDACRAGLKRLQGSGKANAVRDYDLIVEAAEARATRMP